LLPSFDNETVSLSAKVVVHSKRLVHLHYALLLLFGSGLWFGMVMLYQSPRVFYLLNLSWAKVLILCAFSDIVAVCFVISYDD